MPIEPSILITLLERRGPLPARDVLRALGVSQPTLSRLLRASGPRVRRIGQTRASTYAVGREVRTLGDAWPVYRVDRTGRVRKVAKLHALHPNAWWYEADAPALLPSGKLGLLPDLPWFFDDLRPQGFMGRAFARRHASELGLPEDPRSWSSDGVLVATLLHGHDLPGDFLIGHTAVERAQSMMLVEPDAIPAARRLAQYRTLAEETLSSGPVGSSAAGEQPKFTAVVRDRDGSVRHVIVKLSPILGNASGRRWADLLLCEHLASEQLSKHGVAASRTEWLRGDERAFLEVTRFDRVDSHGRLGVVSLLALCAELGEALDSWARVSERLALEGLLSTRDAATLAKLWWFGRLIANTDMHFGNVSLRLPADAKRPLGLAPVYDMLPMGLAPGPTGEIRARTHAIALPDPEMREPWREAAELAIRYWERVLDDGRLSREFRAEVRGRPAEIRRVRARS
jgi:hypothetical protein